VAVIDYGMGNRRSVEKALEHTGAHVTLTADLDVLRQADGLVLPGVGAFGQAMVNLKRLELDGALPELVAAGVPLLGVCLGMQLLFEASEEHGRHAGLGLLAGEVTPLRAAGRRLPHIGWNLVRTERENPVLPVGERFFYHVHSLAVRPADPEAVLASTEYGERFATVIGQRNVFGVQFHPEKSSGDGLELLGRFTRLAQSHRERMARA
jgi:glutamine amidotransferase